MKHQQSLIEYRKLIESRLREWIPNNDALVIQELNIFDRIMSRRDFLKNSSMTATMAIMGSGCGSSNRANMPPSSWPECEETPPCIEEKILVPKASKIVVDSDIIDGMQHYNALASLGSDDAPEVKGASFIESFNPHLMTIDSQSTFTQSGFNPVERNYGIPEIVHLIKDSSSSDYSLAIYENGSNGRQGLKKSDIVLEKTSLLNFNKLISANGNFHNRVENRNVYSQKMVLLADTYSSVEPDFRLYYQTNSSEILQPGVKGFENNTWDFLDVMETFKAHEDHVFSNYHIQDINTYQDGHNHSFIYGTIKFDNYYNYGFVVTFNSITDSAPTVTFFTPKFLSVNSNVVSDLVEDFNNAELESSDTIADFSIFADQKFIPVSQVVDVNGKTDSNILFSFVCFDSASDPEYSEAYSSGGEFDLDHFCNIDSSIIKRYVVAVESLGGVQYLLDAYTTNTEISVDSDTFTLDFDTNKIPAFDIWKSVYKLDDTKNSLANVQLRHSFIRSIINNGSSLELLLATSLYDEENFGIVQKSIKIDYTSLDALSLDTENLYSSKSIFDEALHDGKDYKELWFNTMKGSNNSYQSLSDCVYADNRYYDFYCTHNHQGLLRSYFIIRVKHDDGSSHSFLFNFEEMGVNSVASAPQIYDHQTSDSLKEQIKQGTVEHRPPLLITINAHKMHPWRAVGQNNEVLYSAKRLYMTDEETKTLQPNDGSRRLLSYYHATSDFIEGVWNTHEHEVQVPMGDPNIKKYLYTNTKHQLHLHINNIYDYPATLDDTTFVELRFSRSLVVTDHTLPDTPSTFEVTRNTSLFLKPNDASKITLEISAGIGKNTMLKGATVMYRFLNQADIEVQEDAPVAFLNSTTDETTTFQQCNLSFRQFERLSTTNVASHQSGVSPDTDTAHQIFHHYVKDGEADTIATFTDAYGKLYEATKPANSTSTEIFRHRSTQHLVDPLVFKSGLFRQQLATRSLADDVVDWADKAVETVNNVVESATDLTEELTKQLKKTVGALVDEIQNIVTHINKGLGNIITQIGIAFEKILDTLKTLAELIWDFIKAFVDVDSAWQVGSELRQIYFDQFSPDSTVNGNAYGIIKNKTQDVQDNIDTTVENMKDDVYSAIDKALNQDLDKNHEQADIIRKKSQHHSVKLHHIGHQTDRITASIKSSATTRVLSRSTLCSSHDTVEELVKCMGNNILNNSTITDDVKEVVNNNKELFADIVKGKGLNELKSDLDSMSKKLADLVLDEADIILDGAVQLPLAFLNGSSLLDALEEMVDDIFTGVIELLSQLLFHDKQKIKTLKDLSYLMTGYMMNILGELVDFNKTDFSSYLKSGDLRKDLNGVGNIKKREEATSTEVVVYSCECISWLAEIVLLGLEIAEVGKEFYAKPTEMILLYIRVTMRAPKIVLHAQEDSGSKELLLILNDILLMASFLVKAHYTYKEHQSKEDDEDDVKLEKAVYTILNLYARFTDFSVALAQQSEADTKEEQKNAVCDLIKTLLSFIQACSKIFTELPDNAEADKWWSFVYLAMSVIKVVLSAMQIYDEKQILIKTTLRVSK